MMMIASANRDERRYLDPEQFDVTRDAADQLGFGFGTHHCAGAAIARLEIAALLKALIPRVARFEIVRQQRASLVSLQGLKHLQVNVS